MKLTSHFQNSRVIDRPVALPQRVPQKVLKKALALKSEKKNKSPLMQANEIHIFHKNSTLWFHLG